jgi:uncharacterized protein (TIGR01777 family)
MVTETDNPPLEGNPMKTLLTGCSGLVGTALIEHLFKKGHSIQCLKRHNGPESDSFWATEKLTDQDGTGFDTVIHLAGENVASGRWTKKKKQAILDSRIEGTRALVDYILDQENKPGLFLCASAIGFYGDRGKEILYENSMQGVGFLSEVCRRWEYETNRLRDAGIRVVNMRFGMILSPLGGALHKMLPPIRMGAGGTIGSGAQYISWLSIRDLVEIVDFIIHREKIHGPVNFVSRIQTTNLEMTKLIGKILGRPTPFKIPASVAGLLLGEMAGQLLLASSRVSPRVLLESGYQFRDQSLESVLEYCIRGE